MIPFVFGELGEGVTRPKPDTPFPRHPAHGAGRVLMIRLPWGFPELFFVFLSDRHTKSGAFTDFSEKTPLFSPILFVKLVFYEKFPNNRT